MTPEQAKAIEGFRTQLLAIRSELRDVQFALRRDVDNLKNLGYRGQCRGRAGDGRRHRAGLRIAPPPAPGAEEA